MSFPLSLKTGLEEVQSGPELPLPSERGVYGTVWLSSYQDVHGFRLSYLGGGAAAVCACAALIAIIFDKWLICLITHFQGEHCLNLWKPQSSPSPLRSFPLHGILSFWCFRDAVDYMKQLRLTRPDPRGHSSWSGRACPAVAPRRRRGRAQSREGRRPRRVAPSVRSARVTGAAALG